MTNFVDYSFVQNIPLVGIGQTWQNVPASRVAGTTYTNSTTKPIFVNVVTGTSGSQNFQLNDVSQVISSIGITNGQTGNVCGIILPGHTYSVTTTAGQIALWMELR